jgi:hypothetical protein
VPDVRDAAAGSASAPSISSIAAMVTIGRSPQADPPQGHFRPAVSGLKFMQIP